VESVEELFWLRAKMSPRKCAQNTGRHAVTSVPAAKYDLFTQLTNSGFGFKLILLIS